MNAVTKDLRVGAANDSFEVIRAEANVGAFVKGLDLTAPLTDATADLLRSLLWEHQVLFFRDTGIDSDQQKAITRIFGELDVDSIAKRRGATADRVEPMNTGPYSDAYYGTPWHADATYRERPYIVSVLRSVIAPELGGDTVWSSAVSAYASLSEEAKQRIDGLTAIHRPDHKARSLIKDQAELKEYLSEYSGVVHPVVITHPFNGKKILYVNEGFTEEIIGLPDKEGKELLDYLTRLFYRPEHQVRFKWRPGSLAIWDNRAVQHRGVPDYGNVPRQLVRFVAQGDTPAH